MSRLPPDLVMVARPGSVRYFADESIMGLGKGLAYIRQDFIYPGHKLIPEVLPGAQDDEWIPVVAERNLIAFGRDKRLRTRPGEKPLLIFHRLRVVRIAVKRDVSTWQQLLILVRHWESLEAKIAELGDGPWFLAINEREIKQVEIGA